MDIKETIMKLCMDRIEVYRHKKTNRDYLIFPGMTLSSMSGNKKYVVYLNSNYIDKNIVPNVDVIFVREADEFMDGRFSDTGKCISGNDIHIDELSGYASWAKDELHTFVTILDIKVIDATNSVNGPAYLIRNGRELMVAHSVYRNYDESPTEQDAAIAREKDYPITCRDHILGFIYEGEDGPQFVRELESVYHTVPYKILFSIENNAKFIHCPNCGHKLDIRRRTIQNKNGMITVMWDENNPMPKD